MPRYFFNLRDRDLYIADEEGTDLPDLIAAEQLAIHSARDLMGHDIRRGRLVLGNAILIADESGAVVSTIIFRDAVEILEPPAA
jgi:hypothetical protein